jgi:PD-(D/E)XK endonuclease
MQPRVSFLRDTKRTGDISELHVTAALAQHGYRSSILFGENHRCDVVIERDGRFERVQIKTGRLRNG